MTNQLSLFQMFNFVFFCNKIIFHNIQDPNKALSIQYNNKNQVVYNQQSSVNWQDWYKLNMTSTTSQVYGGDEISAIVIDPGSYVTNIGFSGTDCPQVILTSSFGEYINLNNK